MVKFLDPGIDRKKNLSKKNLYFFENTNIPMPSEVEISESGLCNRKCSFCPRSDPKYNHVNEFINKNLHTNLCNELKKYNYKGIVRYSGFVEPLLDKNIYNLIREAKNINEGCRVELVTNGDVLNKKRLKKLFDFGLTTILISVYDSETDALMFESMCKSLGLEDGKDYLIRRRFLPAEQDFGITMSNRAGMLENAEYKLMPLKEPLKKKCNYPAYTFFLDYNGDVLMCAHDWGKKRILGNLYKKTFYEIWNSQLALMSRQKLLNKDRNFSPCNVCDVQGELIGNEHATAWLKKLNENK